MWGELVDKALRDHSAVLYVHRSSHGSDPHGKQYDIYHYKSFLMKFSYLPQQSRPDIVGI